jgi:hypothetical protein
MIYLIYTYRLEPAEKVTSLAGGSQGGGAGRFVTGPYSTLRGGAGELRTAAERKMLSGVRH